MSKSKSLGMLQAYLKFIKSGQGFEHIIRDVNITAEKGNCIAEFVVKPEQTNAFGYLHGSYSASLVDMISGIALLSHEKEGGGVSVNMNLTYMKGAKIGDKILIEAKTVKCGNNLGFLEVEIKNKDTGDLLVTGTHTKYIG